MHFKYYLNNFSRFIPLGSAFPRARLSGHRERVCLACSGTVKGKGKGSAREFLTKTIWLLGVWQYCQNVMLFLWSVSVYTLCQETHFMCVI